MASLDTRRPAAQEQLKVLGEQTGVATLPIIAGQTPIQIANRAMDAGKLGSYDVVMLDTAGRTTVDEELMREVANVKQATNPHEVCSSPTASPVRTRSTPRKPSKTASASPALC